MQSRDNETQTSPNELWPQNAPLLDIAIANLSEKDRQVIVLRFFQNKTLAEVGAAVGAGKDSARMRVNRALEKLRKFFLKRGVASTTAIIAGTISVNSVHAAPAALAKTISAVALTKGAAASLSTLTLTKGALKIMAWTKAKTIVAVAVVASATTALIVQQNTQNKLRTENESLQAQIKTPQNSSSPAEKPVAPVDPKTLRDEQWRELMRLRGEVGMLRQRTNDLGNLLANTRNIALRNANPPHEDQQPAQPLPADYPKTADGATKGIFEAWAQGDWENFFTNFGQPGVTRDFYDQIFTDKFKDGLAGMQIISVGEPTNGFGGKKWFVPYKIRLKNGSEKEHRLSLGKDPKTGRWYFDGGF